jgi:hypothetical protein
MDTEITKVVNSRKKHGGRTKGTPNVATAEIKTLLSNFIQLEMERIEETFLAAPPSERLKFLAAIMQFAIPRLKDTEVNASVNLVPITFEFS